MPNLPNLIFVDGFELSTGTVDIPDAGGRWRVVRYQPFNGVGGSLAGPLSGSEGGMAVADGSSTVLGIGMGIADTVGSSVGLAIVLGSSTDTVIVSGVGASDGLATALGVGSTVSTIASGVGASIGLATVTGYTETFEARFAIAGTSTFSFVGAMPIVATAVFTYTQTPAYLIVEID